MSKLVPVIWLYVAAFLGVITGFCTCAALASHAIRALRRKILKMEFDAFWKPILSKEDKEKLKAAIKDLYTGLKGLKETKERARELGLEFKEEK